MSGKTVLRSLQCIPKRNVCKVANQNDMSNRFYTNKNLLSLSKRGMLKDVFPESDPALYKMLTKQQCVYAGFDPSADSLHIGNLAVLMTLLHAQRGGHEVIAVIGGATALIGDPSGKKSERECLDADVVEANSRSIISCVQDIFENHEKYFWKDRSKESPLYPIRILNNLDWYTKVNVIEFLRTTGKLMRMGQMLSRHSVESRLYSKEGLSLAEFSYQSFQAHDWLHLCRKYNCHLQVGGSDQMGNIYAGYELISKTIGSPCYGFTIPLVTSEEGDKLGKTAGNAVWLNPKKMSPFEFYQFFMRTPDSKVMECLNFFTFLAQGDIEQLMENHTKSPESWIAQKKLAEQVTLLVHGESGLKSAKRTTDMLYHGSSEKLAMLTTEELYQVFQQAKATNLMLKPGTTILQMCMLANCFSRECDAERIAAAGGLHVNYRKVTNLNYVLVPGEHILPNKCTLIKVGKRNYYIINWDI